MHQSLNDTPLSEVIRFGLFLRVRSFVIRLRVATIHVAHVRRLRSIGDRRLETPHPVATPDAPTSKNLNPFILPRFE